jgi:acyl-CoA thioester hydrolase
MANQAITRDDFCYWTEVEVRWGDMDNQGHVNNAVYFTYCESARVRFFGQLGHHGRRTDSEGPSLVSTTCNFRKEVVYPATLDVGLRVEEIGGRSFRIEFGMFNQATGDLVASGSSVTAWTDYTVKKAIPIPDDVRADLERYRL